MFKQKKWQFSGKSGREYTFEIIPKTYEHPEYGGIYLLTYTHPRGHRAGFKVNMLYAGIADNFCKTLAAPPNKDCLWEGNWNCIYLLQIDEGRRAEVLADIIAGNEMACI